jgi:phosphate transport system ATP-binding protein
MTDDRTPKIIIDHLSFSYGDGAEGLRDVSLNIFPHEITALFGPAGGGKSTLLRALNRLNDLVKGTWMSGRIWLDGPQGVDIFAPGVDVIALRRRVGIVFAQPIGLPMSIRQNIEYGLTLAGVHDRIKLEQTVERSLRQAALWDEIQDRLNDPAMALSGGQLQRLCLARVLALEPEVILLDEPTSGLDPISTAKVEQSLQALKAQYTIVIAPHNIQQAARVADHAAFFLQGQLIEDGPGKVLFTNPRNKRTEDYVTGRFG